MPWVRFFHTVSGEKQIVMITDSRDAALAPLSQNDEVALRRLPVDLMAQSGGNQGERLWRWRDSSWQPIEPMHPPKRVEFDWTTVTTWAAFQTAMGRFLRGELTTSCNHTGPLEEESVCIQTPLIRLTDLGFITLSSQPGDTDYHRGQEQRAYVEGCMRHSILPLFLSQILEFPELALLTWYRQRWRRHGPRRLWTEITEGRTAMVPLTRTRQENGRWKVITRQRLSPRHNPIDLLRLPSMFSRWLAHDAVYVIILQRMWGRNDLWDWILKALPPLHPN